MRTKQVLKEFRRVSIFQKAFRYLSDQGTRYFNVESISKSNNLIPKSKSKNSRYLVEKMAYNNGGTIMPYPQQGNGYTPQPVPNFNQRPNNVRKVGKHEDEEAGKLFVGGLR